MENFRAPAPAPGKTWLRSAPAPGPWQSPNSEVSVYLNKQKFGPLNICVKWRRLNIDSVNNKWLNK